MEGTNAALAPDLPSEKGVDLGLSSRPEQIQFDPIPKNRIPIDSIKKVWTEKRKPIVAVAVLLLVALPIFFFSSQDEKEEVVKQTEEMKSPVASSPTEDGSHPAEPNAASQEESEQVEEQPKEEQQEWNNNYLSFQDSNLSSGDHSESGTTVVPQLIGLSKQEAEQQVREARLYYDYYLEFNDQQEGTVFKQDMEAGATVSKGARITFWISKGPGL